MMTRTQYTENELIDGCLRGDRLIQRELYDRYKNAMFTLAYRVMGQSEQAEDVLQEAFVKIFAHIAKFRRESTLGAWIKTIVVRTAYNKLRERKIRTEPEEAIPMETTLDWGSRPFEAEYLEKAILALPEGYRMVFVLIEIEGYAHREAAELLGISEGTSKSQLFYAKKRLRQELAHYGYE